MNISQAIQEFESINIQMVGARFAEVAEDLWERDLPLEIITRLKEVWRKTLLVGGRIIPLGKLIVLKIWDFIRANPGLALGIVLGAAIGALVNLIPLLGAWLSPLTISVGALVGAARGHHLDRLNTGEPATHDTFQNLLAAAQRVFGLLADIIRCLHISD